MKFTVGKLVWGISILIFLGFAYGHSMFVRVQSIFEGSGSTETHVQSYIIEQQPSDVERLPIDDLIGTVGSVSTSDTEDSEFYLDMELLKYRVQELEDDYEKVRIEIKEAHEEKNDSMDNLLAIMITLLPIAIPYFTRKSHDKEITFKKEVKK